jgi:2-dehydro-3-deoxyphosphooctonate aldolase (KDO 8-P synthase)
METHPKPSEAWSDGPNAVPLGKMKNLLETLVELDAVTKKHPLLENDFSA